jgi:ankyrin repeat protein
VTLLLQLHDVEYCVDYQTSTYLLLYLSISAIHRQDGDRALRIASLVGQVEVVKLLLDRGADIEASSDVNYITMASYFR